MIFSLIIYFFNKTHFWLRSFPDGVKWVVSWLKVITVIGWRIKLLLWEAVALFWNVTVTLFNIMREFPTWVYVLVLFCCSGRFFSGAFFSGPSTGCCALWGRASWCGTRPGCLSSSCSSRLLRAATGASPRTARPRCTTAWWSPFVSWACPVRESHDHHEHFVV